MPNYTTSRTLARPYGSNGNIMDTRGCNSILFKNDGNVTAYVNDYIIIEPQAAVAINQPDVNVKDCTEYSVKFEETNPLTDIPLLTVITSFITDY